MARHAAITIGLLMTISMSSLADNPEVVKSGPYQTAVVELYTSEGCSSCPPADQWLRELVGVPNEALDVLALAFHVDYWDYLGWKDEFADPSYSARQRNLGRLNRQRVIYTPAFYVGGREARGTSAVLERIRAVNQTRAKVDLELSTGVKPMQYLLQLKSRSRESSKLTVQFVAYEKGLNNEVARGENAGRTLRHENVVRYLSPVIDLQPQISHSIDIERDWNKDNLGFAALVRADDDEYVQSVFSTVPRYSQ